jgi:hypothetical protein
MSCGTDRNSTRPISSPTPAGNHKPRSTVNHFGGSLGGPIVHDKLFFFFDSEWVRIALPIVTATTVPTRRFRATSCSNFRSAERILSPDRRIRRRRSSCPFYQKMFSLYGNTAGTPLAVLGCPFNSDGSAAGGQSAQWKRLREPAERFAFERRSRAGADRPRRLQHRPERNTAWFRFQADTGCRPPIPIRSIRCSTPSLRSRCTPSRPATRTSSPGIW